MFRKNNTLDRSELFSPGNTVPGRLKMRLENHRPTLFHKDILWYKVFLHPYIPIQMLPPLRQTYLSALKYRKRFREPILDHASAPPGTKPYEDAKRFLSKQAEDALASVDFSVEKVGAEVFNGPRVVQRIDHCENEDDSKDDGSEFQAILRPDAFILSILAVREF